MGSTVRQRGEMFTGYSQLTTMCCPTCGVLYAIPEQMRAYAERLGNFDFPDVVAVAEIVPVRAVPLVECSLARLSLSARLCAELDQTQASLRAQRGATTRARNQRDKDRKRIAAGVCPCCNRSFANLARHMAGQHPEYGPLGDHDQ